MNCYLFSCFFFPTCPLLLSFLFLFFLLAHCFFFSCFFFSCYFFSYLKLLLSFLLPFFLLLSFRAPPNAYGLWFEWRHIAWLDKFFYINSEHVPLPTQRGFKPILWQNKCDEFFSLVNTLRPRQNGRHFTDDIFKCIFLNENAWILLKISLKFVPKVWINIPALVQIMAWRRPGDKPLSEPMMVNLLTHRCVTLPQWVKIPVVQFTMVLKTIFFDMVHFVMWFLFI